MPNRRQTNAVLLSFDRTVHAAVWLLALCPAVLCFSCDDSESFELAPVAQETTRPAAQSDRLFNALSSRVSQLWYATGAEYSSQRAVIAHSSGGNVDRALDDIRLIKLQALESTGTVSYTEYHSDIVDSHFYTIEWEQNGVREVLDFRYGDGTYPDEDLNAN